MCLECGGLVKGDTVMFGEPIPCRVLDRCFEATERCDGMLAAGTSATICPAASFPHTIKERGGYLIEANPSDTPLSGYSDVILRGRTGETLPRVVQRVKEIKGV